MKKILLLMLALAGSTANAISLEEKVDLLASELEKVKASQYKFALKNQNTSKFGMGTSAAKVYHVDQGISFGGYGEFLYEDYSSKKEDNSANGQSTKFDALRAIIYMGYKFNEKWVFNSEIEVEHADEIFLEFSYLEYLHSSYFNIRGGLLLTPMGFVNELHEPTLYLGAKRPQIEQKILPSTWRGNGIGFLGAFNNFDYKLYYMTGFDSDGTGGSPASGKMFSKSGLRDGRQKGSKAEADDMAVVARLDYKVHGFENLQIGASYWKGGENDALRKSLDLTIFEYHAQLRWKGFQARFLSTSADLGDSVNIEAFNTANSGTVPEKMKGFYYELGYDVFTLSNQDYGELIPFIRIEEYDTNETVVTGQTKDLSKEVNIMTYGVVYKPLFNIAIKADIMKFENKAKTGVEQVNVSFGYQF